MTTNTVATTRTVADKALLDLIEKDEIAKAFNEECLSLQLAQRKRKQWSGRKVLFDTKMYEEAGVGYRGEGEGLPAPQPGLHVNGEVYVKAMYGVGELTYEAIKSSQGDRASFIELLTDSIEGTMGKMKKRLNRDFLSDGRAIRATVATGGTLAKEDTSTLQIVVDTTRYLAPNDVVALWTDATTTSTVLANGGQTNVAGTSDSEHVKVSTIDSDTKLTLVRTAAAAGDATVATSNVVRFYGDAIAGSPITHNTVMGVGGFADDGTYQGTLEGISRTTYPQWKGVVIAAGSVDLTSDHIRRLADRVHRNSGEDIDVLIADATLRRSFLNITDADKRYKSVTDNDPGARGRLVMSVNDREVPFMSDYDVPFGVIYGFPKGALEWWSMDDLHLDDTNGVLKQGKPYPTSGGGDVWYYYLRMHGNFATKKAYAFGKLSGLNYVAEV